MQLASLLVCGDAQTVQVLSRILNDAGMTVENCGDPFTALPLLSGNQFKLIFVDCQNENGAMNMISDVRRRPDQKDAILIAMVDNRNQVREMFARGANFVLFKPISPARLKQSPAPRLKVRSERRLRPRIPLDANASIAYASTENENIKVLDLSEDGIAISSHKNLPRDCKVYFQFSLPGDASTIRLSGEVIWQNDSRHVGLRFVDVPKSSRATLTRWISTNVAGKLQVTQSTPSSEEAFSINLLIAQLGLVSASAPERRQQTRHTCSVGAEVYCAGSDVQQRCMVTDISEGGCYVQTTEPLPVGSEVQVVLRMEDLKLKVWGKVQSVHRGMGMGVHLREITPPQAQQLHDLIFRVNRSHEAAPQAL